MATFSVTPENGTTISPGGSIVYYVSGQVESSKYESYFHAPFTNYDDRYYPRTEVSYNGSVQAVYNGSNNSCMMHSLAVPSNASSFSVTSYFYVVYVDGDADIIPVTTTYNIVLPKSKIEWNNGSLMINSSSSDVSTSSSTATLSWPKAKDGTNNAFSAYNIQYRSRSNSSASWSGYANYGSNITNVNTTSLSVNTPSTVGAQYQFTIQAQGSDSNYYSDPLTSPVLTRTGTQIEWNSGASCTLSATTSTGGSVTLSWPAAKDGTLNAVSHYVIQRKEYSGSWGSYANLTTTTGTSLSVDPPATLGNQYKYRVQAVGPIGGNYNSVWLETANSLSPQATNCIEPKSVALNASIAYVGNTVTLSWSGASGGAYNPITGYHIYKSTDGTTYSKLTEVSSTSANGSLSGLAVGNAGQTVYFKVYTIGTVSGKNSGASAAASVTAQAVVYPTVFRNIVVRKNNQNVKSSICVRAGSSWIPVNVRKYDAANNKWVYCGNWPTA